MQIKNLNLSSLRFALLIALQCIAFSSRAQWSIGLQAGYTHNSLTTSSGYFYDRVYHPQGGFTIGIPVKYTFTDWFALGAEATFVQKGYDARRSGFYDILHDDVSNNYLSVPLYARFSFGGTRLRGFVNAGGYLSGWLSSYRKGTVYENFGSSDSESIFGLEDIKTIYHYDEKVEFDSRRDNRFEAGAMAGAGISYQLIANLEIFGECRYYHSLTDMQKDYMKKQVPRYNNTFAFQAGVMFYFGN